MATAFDSITDAMRSFIERQHVFFVATAPSQDGRINLSPKGYDSLRVLDDHTVAYLDLTGSGAETIAHLRDNGRITFMFCAFEGKPNIVRFYGTGTAHRPGDARFEALRALFDELPGIRAIVTATIDRTQSSCGFAVPFLDYVGERETLQDWAAKRSDDELDEYRATKNVASIDGLPALS